MWRNNLANLSSAQIKDHLKDAPADREIAELLKADGRKSVQQLGLTLERKCTKQDALLERFERMSRFENEALDQGCRWIAGIDEVGRGPLAGPVVAAAVILEPGTVILGLDDSKRVTQKNRERLYEEILQKAVSVGIARVDSPRIDEINILNAAKEAMAEAVGQLDPEPDMLLIDAVTLDLPHPQRSMVKGDQLSNSIAAASIVAKVVRDAMMVEYAKTYPHYDFESNKGYGTLRHYEGLKAAGMTPIHRKTFLKGW